MKKTRRIVFATCSKSTTTGHLIYKLGGIDKRVIGEWVLISLLRICRTCCKADSQQLRNLPARDCLSSET